MPPCTFFTKPIPGIKAFHPLTMENSIPLTINGITLNTPKNFQENLHAELQKIIGSKYNLLPQNVPIQIVRYSMHFAAHNTHKMVSALMKAEVGPVNSWSFDGQIVLDNFVRNQNFAIIFQFVISVEVDLEFTKAANTALNKEIPKEKQIFDIPLGFGSCVPTADAEFSVKLSRESRYSPFGIRVLKTDTPIPSVTFNVNFKPVIGKSNEMRDLPIEFKPLLNEDGSSLLPFDPKDAPEVPLLNQELEDVFNTNHILILFKFITARNCFTERFPLNIIRHLYVTIDLWPFGIFKTKSFRFVPLQDALVFKEDNTKGDEYGVFIKKDISLKVYEHVINYFFLMRANELQASIIDTDTGMILGNFNIPSAVLLRQKRPSVQFTSYSKLTALDGELLGSLHFSCGCYGTTDHKITNLDFERRNTTQKNLIIAHPIYMHDEEFRKSIKSSVLPRFELAARYRDGKRKEVLLNDMQKRFLRTRIIYPIPCLESRFVFVSAFDPDEKTTVTVHAADERVRLIRKMDPDEKIDFEYSYHIYRNDSIEFNQSPDTPISEKFHLITQKDNTFVARPGEEIRLLFGFFTVSEFEDNEISVSLTGEKKTLVDCFTVQIKKTVSLAHENVHVATQSGGIIATTLNSVHQITSAIASSSLITAMASNYGTRLTSQPLESSLRCFVLCFGQDNSLLKLIRLHVDVMPDEVLMVNSKLKINLSKYVGKRICCKSSDARVAKFLTHTEPSILKDAEDIIVNSFQAGVVQLLINNLSTESPPASILLKVGETKDESGNQRCIGKSDITIKIGEGAKRTVQYKNTQNRQKTIRLTTSHPNLITFDPNYYDVGPLQSIKLRIIFMAHRKEEYVTIHAFVQESGQPRSGNEYYKLHVHYVPNKKPEEDSI